MAKDVLHEPATRVSKIEDSIQDAELLLSIRITLHDLSRVFVCEDGSSLLDAWRGSHRRYHTCAIGYRKECLRHCFQGVNRRAATTVDPFVHHCFKGFVELVVPIRREGVHVATLFAGQWRTPDPGEEESPREPPNCSAIPEGRDSRRSAKQWVDRLPLAESAELGRLTGVLSAFAAGLLARADEIRGRRQHPVSRKEAILNFVELHAASSVTLQGLAAALHLSPSRTSHLVRELTGRSFKELVVAERLRRAQGLLRSTDLTVAEVGRLVGVPNVCHFSRLFRAKMGVPPGSYRADGPLPENRPDVPD